MDTFTRDGWTQGCQASQAKTVSVPVAQPPLGVLARAPQDPSSSWKARHLLLGPLDPGCLLPFLPDSKWSGLPETQATVCGRLTAVRSQPVSQNATAPPPLANLHPHAATVSLPALASVPPAPHGLALSPPLHGEPPSPLSAHLWVALKCALSQLPPALLLRVHLASCFPPDLYTRPGADVEILVMDGQMDLKCS